eukprot:CAMPEP_0204379920 /NCGR_PEP_ID=MMETSP0469-20131031/52964_1 /ASSEMBLY_ACC=CAM_ASM_000384 /TAXON_ID=2969 /ORGANISM="Oxyrrhis marina" /LENGTH=41 /DNA_ID= /DNA_START= /DNA_END= /DNA_ORIENTATION=
MEKYRCSSSSPAFARIHTRVIAGGAGMPASAWLPSTGSPPA